MKSIYYISFLLVLLTSGVSSANDNVLGILSAKVMYIDSNSVERPIVGRNIRLEYNGSIYKKIAITDREGEFNLLINNKHPLIRGGKIKITILDSNYFILSPFNGVMFTPRSLANYKLEILAVKDKSYIVNDRINARFIFNSNIQNNNSKIYTIQVRSTPSNYEAIQIRKKLKRDGYDVHINKSYIDHQYKVYISRFYSIKEAKKYNKKIKNSLIRKYKYSDSFATIER